MDVLHRSAKLLHLLIGAITGSLVFACSNSEGNDATGTEIIAAVESNSHDIEYASPSQETSSAKTFDYIPIDDSEYPYAGIPRIVIETENHREIKDRETEIPARLQIWGEKAPESEIMDLTIRGRGNTSWDAPKTSFKIEFINKQEMLGMPKDRDWALIANYADKTLMKNYLAYHLSAELGAYYAPRCEFVELYLNKDYLGVYLLTETVKIGKNRINIPNNENSYIVEVDGKYRKDEQIVFSDIIKNSGYGKTFKVHNPKNAAEGSLITLQDHIQDFERYLKNIDNSYENNIAQWLDIDEFIKHYWIQEFSKNPDAGFYTSNYAPESGFFTSVFFIWTKNDVIRMGPVWDFDLAFGGHADKELDQPQNWHFKNAYWNYYLFKDSMIQQLCHDFWVNQKDYFSSTLNTIDSIQSYLNSAASNNFKRWNILSSTSYNFHPFAYSNYNNAIVGLKKWISQRLLWIDSNLDY